jgi:hypothetical protein
MIGGLECTSLRPSHSYTNLHCPEATAYSTSSIRHCGDEQALRRGIDYVRLGMVSDRRQASLDKTGCDSVDFMRET